MFGLFLFGKLGQEGTIPHLLQKVKAKCVFERAIGIQKLNTVCEALDTACSHCLKAWNFYMESGFSFILSDSAKPAICHLSEI